MTSDSSKTYFATDEGDLESGEGERKHKIEYTLSSCSIANMDTIFNHFELQQNEYTFYLLKDVNRWQSQEKRLLE